MTGRQEEAARWFAAARRGVMLHEERAAFDRWSADPLNAVALAEVAAVWAELDPVPIAPPAPADDRKRVRFQIAAMAAFVALTAGLLPRIDGIWWNTLDWWSR
jgi:ferric-dicitrate binding protein FerR (iron transport regulator)